MLSNILVWTFWIYLATFFALQKSISISETLLIIYGGKNDRLGFITWPDLGLDRLRMRNMHLLTIERLLVLAAVLACAHVYLLRTTYRQLIENEKKISSLWWFSSANQRAYFWNDLKFKCSGKIFVEASEDEK